mgnify:CR=1 FL=1
MLINLKQFVKWRANILLYITSFSINLFSANKQNKYTHNGSNNQ